LIPLLCSNYGILFPGDAVFITLCNYHYYVMGVGNDFIIDHIWK